MRGTLLTLLVVGSLAQLLTEIRDSSPTCRTTGALSRVLAPNA